MALNNQAEWTASAVSRAVLNSGKSKLQVAQEAAIPERTFYRKLRDGGGGFDWDELLRIAEVTGVAPWTLTPPAFQKEDAA